MFIKKLYNKKPRVPVIMNHRV